MPSQDA